MRRGPRWRQLPPLLALALGMLLSGFLLGRAGTRSSAVDVDGVQDYRALAYYNQYTIARAQGSSMQPTLAQYNFLLVRRKGQVRRGDILVSRHHGDHRVVGLPGETVWLLHGTVRVCTPRPSGVADCRFLNEPYVQYHPLVPKDVGPVHLTDGYATVPDNRLCCQAIYLVPLGDVLGVAAGSLLSYGSLGGSGDAMRPYTPTLVYEH